MPERKLAEQLERLPLNRFLRSEVLAGAETLSDEQAREKAAELKTSLDRLPGLLEQLRGDRQEVRSASVQAKAEPLSVEASGRESGQGSEQR